MLSDSIRRAIVEAATEQGIPPAAALAIAERESSFNPRARASKTIRGLFQMRGDLRSQYGIGDSDDPYAQAKGWGTFFKDVKKQMAGTLGRDPTDAEAYLGHHFGAKRAARMMKMDPSTPVNNVFTPNEMRLNPHFARAGTVGALNSSVISDITRREGKYGGATVAPADPMDFSAFSAPVEDFLTPQAGQSSTQMAAADLPDFSAMSMPADDFTASPRASAKPAALPDFSAVSAAPESFGMASAPSNAPPQIPSSSVQPSSGVPDFSQFGVPA